MADNPTDIVLRYHVRLDGLSNGVLADMAADIERALAKVIAEIERRGDDGTFTSARLAELRTELTAARTALRERIQNGVRDSLDAVLETSGRVIAQTAQSLSGSLSGASSGIPVVLDTIAVPVAAMAAVAGQPFDGFTWQRWGAKLAEDTLGRVESELRQAVALGEGIPDIRKRLEKTAGLSKQSAERLARTAINSTANRARVEGLRRFAGDLVKGWRYTSVLDGRTSDICRGLDGQVFRADDPKIPFPPRHPNCRGVLLPLSALDDKPAGERPAVRSTFTRKEEGREFRRRARDRVSEKQWKAMDEAERHKEIAKTRRVFRDHTVSRVPASTSYQVWLKRQPVSFQKEVLGPTRYRAFQRGLDVGQMATHDRKLSIAELRRLYPQEMAGL